MGCRAAVVSMIERFQNFLDWLGGVLDIVLGALAWAFISGAIGAIVWLVISGLLLILGA